MEINPEQAALIDVNPPFDEEDSVRFLIQTRAMEKVTEIRDAIGSTFDLLELGAKIADLGEEITELGIREALHMANKASLGAAS